MKEILTCYEKYFDFTGKASRKEFCYFFNFFLVIVIFFPFVLGFVFFKASLDSLKFMHGLIVLLTIIPMLSVTSRRWHDLGHTGWLALLWLFPCINIIFGVYLSYAKGSNDNSNENSWSCLIIALCIFFGIPILAGLGIGAQGLVKEEVGKLQRRTMLRDLYVYLQTYQQDFGSFPSVQPPETSKVQGGGVRDLYPLAYIGRMDEKELNELLHPPGGQFDKFSKEPRAEEFDKNHIGWSYNSCARIDSEEPLMADQGVSSGSLRLQSQDRGIKPLSTKGVMVLLANGRVEYVSANPRNGKLLSDIVKDWGVLKD